MINEIKLSEALQRGNNNFDALRLIAALAVIFGHTFALAPAPGFHDPVYEVVGQHSAALAVKFFFFLSGLLVADSLFTKKSAIQFVIARIFRIWPGLVFVLLFSVFVIGPIATNLDVPSYFSNPDTLRYLKHQVLMQTWGTQALGYYDLPGVFTNNIYKNTVNASLWSLFAEVFAYIVLLAIFCIDFLNKRISVLFIGLIILDAVYPSRLIFNFLPIGNEDFSSLPFCFAIGCLFAIYKDSIHIGIRMPIGFGLLALLFHSNPNACYLLFVSFFTLSLFLGTRSFTIRRLAVPFDISYGVFLWGFPIQQMLSHFLPSLTGTGHCVAAMALSILAGSVSWLLIEKKFISIGRALITSLSH